MELASSRVAQCDGPPEIVPIRPKPRLVRVVHFRLFRWWITAIMRHWSPGDSGPGGRCRLCPKCTAYEDGCLKVVSGRVSQAEAALLDSVKIRRQRGVTG